MTVSCNIATHRARVNVLPKMIDSLRKQSRKPDIVRVYANDYTPDLPTYEEFDLVIGQGEDLTDNGKFYWAGNKDEYYFTMDDDLRYPEDYIESTLNKLNRYPNALVTYHGRTLKGKGRNYYRGHKQHHCLRDQDHDMQIDVPGTGVSAFNTNNIDLSAIAGSKYKKMSDVLAGLECAKKGYKIILLEHSMWWLKSLLEPKQESIYQQHRNDCAVQSELTDQIWDIIK